MDSKDLEHLFFCRFACLLLAADFQFTVTNMYLMSSLARNQQSTAGGIMQTATRISTSVGLGIARSHIPGPFRGHHITTPACHSAPLRAEWLILALSSQKRGHTFHAFNPLVHIPKGKDIASAAVQLIKERDALGPKAQSRLDNTFLQAATTLLQTRTA